MTQSAAPSPMELGKGLGLLALQVLASAIAFYWFALQALSIAGCGDRCDYALATAAHQTQIWGIVALLTSSLIATVWLWLGRRRTWWAPAIGTGALVLLTIGTTIAMKAATQTL